MAPDTKTISPRRNKTLHFEAQLVIVLFNLYGTLLYRYVDLPVRGSFHVKRKQVYVNLRVSAPLVHVLLCVLLCT